MQREMDLTVGGSTSKRENNPGALARNYEKLSDQTMLANGLGLDLFGCRAVDFRRS